MLVSFKATGVAPVMDEEMRRWHEAKHKAGHLYDYKSVEPLENDLLGELLALSTMLACFGWALVGPMLAVTLAYSAVIQCNTAAATVLVILVSSMYLPAQAFWEPWIRSPIWDAWRRYFRFRWVTPHGPFLEVNKKYMFLHFPHGTYPMGSWLSMGILGTEGFPDAGAAIATVLLRAPIYRHIYTWMGCFPAEKEVIINLLRERSLGVTPEGIAGVFFGATKWQERLFFSQRKGLCKIALQTGTDIVPVYMLGQSQVFTFTGFSSLSRKLRVTVGLFRGRWGTVIPQKTDIIMLMGAPISVQQVLEPTTVDVNALHGQVTKEVTALFERHKGLLPGWEKKELRVL